MIHQIHYGLTIDFMQERGEALMYVRLVTMPQGHNFRYWDICAISKSLIAILFNKLALKHWLDICIDVLYDIIKQIKPQIILLHVRLYKTVTKAMIKVLNEWVYIVTCNIVRKRSVDWLRSRVWGTLQDVVFCGCNVLRISSFHFVSFKLSIKW